MFLKLKPVVSRAKTLLPFLPSPVPIYFYFSAMGRRPKKKIYHRVPNLDKAMDLQKKPALLLRLRSIICAQKSRSLLLRDLEKEVGFVKKWNFVSLIEKHPTVFKIFGGGASGSPISVRLTDKAERISSYEVRTRQLMEPILVRHLRKLLMMSLDCRLPLQKIELIQSELGLPENFRQCLIPKYPDFFSVKSVNGLEYLNLESWDSTLAVTVREESLNLGTLKVESKKAVGRDGNFPGPHAFRINYAPGFRPNVHYLEEVQKWQKMAFPSPYLSARMIEPATPQARKRAVAVLHELLSLIMENRLPSNKLDAFHNEYQLPCKLLLCLVKNHGIFYITNKGAKSTVFLKEAYDGSNLIEKCPLLKFQDMFVSLIGRPCPDLDNQLAV